MRQPGALVHTDMKKFGRIRIRGIGFDYIHVVVDDHSRLAYTDIHADETGTTSVGVLLRAAEFFHTGNEGTFISRLSPR